MSATLHKKFQEAFDQATRAGVEAVEATQVTPMYVGTPKNLAASLLGGDDGGFDPDKPIYRVESGVCGFAWINAKADTTEARKFLNWMKGKVKTNYPVTDVLSEYVSDPRPDSYYGGVTVWVGGFGQSMTRKEAFARAFAAKLRDEIDGLRAYGHSRMD